MTSSGVTSQPSTRALDTGCDSERADAVRYVVLRRLAPGLRHSLMGNLQTVQWSAESAARTLSDDAHPERVRDAMGRIVHQCAAAVQTTNAVIEWLRPTEETAIQIRVGIEECLKLAGEDWFLRGIEATTDLPDADFQVPKRPLQELVVTALLVLTDIYEQSADLHVVVTAIVDHVDIVLHGSRAQRETPIPALDHGRKLTWSDLQLVASAVGITCLCNDGTATLRFCRFNGQQAVSA